LKAVYIYDQTSREFQGSKLVDDDYIVQSGETEIKPADGLYEPITFPTDDATAWVGTDKAVWQAAQDAAYQEYLNEHPELAPQPTSEQQQLAELIKDNTQQTSLNVQLIKQVAELKAQLVASTTQEVK
jgi:hypothetical protein